MRMKGQAFLTDAFFAIALIILIITVFLPFFEREKNDKIISESSVSRLCSTTLFSLSASGALDELVIESDYTNRTTKIYSLLDSSPEYLGWELNIINGSEIFMVKNSEQKNSVFSYEVPVYSNRSGKEYIGKAVLRCWLK